jgi:hypothetical protein
LYAEQTTYVKLFSFYGGEDEQDVTSCSLVGFTKNIERALSFETPINIHRSTQCHIPGHRILQAIFGMSEIFCTRPNRFRGPLSFLYSGYQTSFPRLKRPGRGVYPPPSSPDVEERAELYLSSPSEPSWPVLKCNFPL